MRVSRDAFKRMKEAKLCKSDVTEATLVRDKMVSGIGSSLMAETLLRDVDISRENVISMCEASRPTRVNGRNHEGGFSAVKFPASAYHYR